MGRPVALTRGKGHTVLRLIEEVIQYCHYALATEVHIPLETYDLEQLHMILRFDS